MINIQNLFSNFDDLIKKKSVTDSASKYRENKTNTIKSKYTPALNQGVKFKTYQQNIKNNLEKKINFVNSKEGFTNFYEDNNNDLQLSEHGLTIQSKNLINDNDYSSQQETINNLKKHYQDTLDKYNEILNKTKKTTTDYLNRVSSNNPYIGQNVRFNDGTVCYVTQQGVVKAYEDTDSFNFSSGKNGCPSQSSIVDVDIDFKKYTQGNTIPTNPPLLIGSPMKKGQTCGNEGSNVYVNQLINNVSSTYLGCYKDDLNNPLMTFIGGAPPKPPTIEIINPNFSEPKLSDNTYQYVNYWEGQDIIPGWAVNGSIFNNSSAWGYPTPYPNGPQAISMQNVSDVFQNIYCKPGITYTVSFYLCGRPGYVANSILVKVIDYASYDNSLGTINNPPSTWQKYSFNFTVPTELWYQLQFIGQTSVGDNSTALQGVNITTSLDDSQSNGTYTYDQCQQESIDTGYQYFALQNVNSQTSKGYCAVSNSLPTITSLGESFVTTSQTVLWSSNTVGENSGSVAILNGEGSLAVINSSGTTIFLTDIPDSVKSETNPLVGCYGYNSDSSYDIPGTEPYTMTFNQCQDLATDKGYQYYGIGGGIREDKIERCLGFSDINTAKMNGISNGCKNPNGGINSASIYSTSNANVQGACFLIMQDDGNMCIYRGTGPSDNQGAIWCSMTNGKQMQPNPYYAADKGKYGKNWMSSGSTLAIGEFIGSTNGDIALIMQSDGNLVLYTFTQGSNCQKMEDGNFGAGQGGNSIYDIRQISIPSNIGKLAYINENSELFSYPSSDSEYFDSYTKMTSTNSGGYDIPESAYGSATVEQCQTNCNDNPECGGFAFSNNVCYPKTSSMFPVGNRQIDENVDLYIRNKKPINTPTGVLESTFNIDTITYANYNNGGEISMSDKYGLANITNEQKTQLRLLENQMNILSNQINSLTNKFSSGSQNLEQQTETNASGIGNYLNDIKKINNNIKSINNNNFNNILKDSDIVVLQKNYEYLFWSILAVGTVLVTMNIIKK
jgi:hypothetical protein